MLVIYLNRKLVGLLWLVERLKLREEKRGGYNDRRIAK